AAAPGVGVRTVVPEPGGVRKGRSMTTDWGRARVARVRFLSQPPSENGLENVLNGDELVAIGTFSPVSQPAAEQVAVRAAPDVEVALLASWAFVDDRMRAGQISHHDDSVAPAVGSLTAGLRAVPPRPGLPERGTARSEERRVGEGR